MSRRGVGPRPAAERVVAGGPHQLAVALLAADQVVARSAADAIAATTAPDHVRARRPDDHVVAGRALARLVAHAVHLATLGGDGALARVDPAERVVDED